MYTAVETRELVRNTFRSEMGGAFAIHMVVSQSMLSLSHLNCSGVDCAMLFLNRQPPLKYRALVESYGSLL